MQVTTFKISAAGVKTYRRYDMDDIVKMIMSEKFLTRISEFRNDYPLIQREYGQQRNDIIEYRLRELPFLCFATECEKRDGEECIIGCNPLVLISVSNLRSEDMAVAMRSRAAQLPYTRLAFVGVDGRSLNIVCKVQAAGDFQCKTDDAESYRKLLMRGYKMLSKVYSDYLQVTIDTADNLLTANCRVSYDDALYYNTHSAPYVADMKSDALEPMAGLPTYTPAQVKDRDDSDRWQRIFIDNLRKAQSEAFNATDADFETLLLLARYCHETTMPEGLAVAFTTRMGGYCHKATLVRDTFSAEYETEVRNAYPERHLNSTAMLMMRTQQFLNTHFRLRRNALNGVVEYRKNDGIDFEYHVLTKEVMNTMTHMALASGLTSWDKDLSRYINSLYIPSYDPINDWLRSLPAWDGIDRITPLARRIPTDTPDWEHNFHVWMLSMVAQWMGRDEQHGNAIAPILIGGQNTGKTSFCRTLLPEHLMYYYNDSIDFKDEKGVFLALSSFALINIDEFDSLTKRQQPIMKFILSKADVKYRAAYKSYIEQHKRYASFIGTTNSLHPLTDPTGSRRFICVHVTDVIDHATPIDYDQVYAQLREEVMRGERYWFTKEEGDRITLQNKQFQQQQDLPTMIASILRQPHEGEICTPLSLTEVAELLQKKFPALQLDGDVKMKLGRPLTQLGFEVSRTREGRKYKAVVKG